MKSKKRLFGTLAVGGMLLLQACDDDRVSYRHGGWVNYDGRAPISSDYNVIYPPGSQLPAPVLPPVGDNPMPIDPPTAPDDGEGPFSMPSDRFVARRARRLDPAQILARDYRIKYDSALKILSVTTSGRPATELKRFGLKKKDLAPLMKLEMPQAASIARTASALQEAPQKIEALMRGYIRDVKTGVAR